MTKFTPLLLLSLFMFSCNSDQSSTTEKTTERSIPSVEECTYSIGKDLKLEWTAFKTTEKLAVKGSFDDLNFTNDSRNKNLPNLIAHSKFEIITNSINSGNADRDGKLKDIFFRNFDMPETISGFIEECEGDNAGGMVIANITMNEVSNQVQMEYSFRNDSLKLFGSFDLLDWNVDKSLRALHNACLDLHKGKDGIPRTWSTMEISLIAPLQKDCK